MPPTTNTLARTVNVAQLNIRNAPLTGIGGMPNEPAFTIGDWCRQFLLAAPFAWRWNRNTKTIQVRQSTQDYQLNLPDFGWLEQAVVIAQPKNYQLEISLNLGEESVQNQPVRIAARLDDSDGNITFRLFPSPDKDYTLALSYQRAAPIFKSLNETWAPIPDYLSYLYTTGFLAKTYEYLQDPRYGETMVLFLRQTIAANEGLSESQVNLFLGRFLNTQREGTVTQIKAQSGNQGRGLF